MLTWRNGSWQSAFANASHTSQKTVQWLKSRKINFIPKDEWLPNSLELSPMNYFANGYLEKNAEKRRFSSGRGLIAAAEEWKKILLQMFQDALLAWPKRVDVVEKAKGQKVALWKHFLVNALFLS